MLRIGCLFVPGFPLAALYRAEPERRGEVVAATDRDDARALLLAVSPEARARGVPSGISVAQARSIEGSLAIRPVSADLLRSAQEALLDVADSFSPRVEEGGPGVVFLDASGLGSLFESEEDLASLLVSRVRKVGFGGRVGIASTRRVALLVARRGTGAEALSPERERSFLATLPLEDLDPTPRLAATFARWGLRTFDDLVGLPAASVRRRLGEEGFRLRQRAAGEDDLPFRPCERPLRFGETVDCEYAIDRFEPLSFLLHAALERLTARLRVRGFRAGDLSVLLRLENRGVEKRTVAVAAPTNDAKVLLAFLRGSFETRPPNGAIESLVLEATPEPVRTTELDLFAPAGPHPADLEATIARLVTITGTDRVGCPETIDSWDPAAFTTRRFDTNGRNRSTTPLPSLALRAFRPPLALEVRDDRGRPDVIRARCRDDATERQASPLGHVVALAGPWRLQGEWWRGEPLARDYFDVELTDGCVYRIFREHTNDEWFADGVYD